MRKAALLSLAALLLGMFAGCSDSPTSSVPEAQTVDGILLDEQAYRVPNAIIEAYSSTNVLLAVDTTNEDGEFLLVAGTTPASEINIKITHSDFVAFAKDLPSLMNGASARNIAVLLEHRESACGQIRLTVRSDATNAGIDAAEVRLKRNGMLVVKSYTDVNGIIEFNYLIAGSYTLRIAKDGYKVVERAFSIANCDTASFDIRMESAQGGNDSCCHGILTVAVVSKSNNQPIANASVKLLRGGAVLQTGKTNASGIAAFDGICEGEIAVLAAKEGYQSADVSVQFGCNDQKQVTLQLAQNAADSCCHGILNLTVYKDGTQIPVSGAAVKLRKNSTPAKIGTTSATGTVEFDGICEGVYDILIVRDGYESKEVPVTFGCNETKTLTATLVEKPPCSTASLKLRIIDDSTRAWISGATVKIYQGGSLIHTGTTNIEGWFLKDGLTAPATYTVEVSMTDYTSKTITFTYPFCKQIQETVSLVHI